MELSFDITSIFITIGIIQGIFFAIAILNIKKGNKKANAILSAFLITTSISIFGGIYYKTNLYFFIPQIARVNEPFRLLLAPILYIYVKILSSKDSKFNKFDLLHLLPFIANVIYLVPFYFQNKDLKIQYISDQMLNKSNFLLMSNQIFLVIMVIQILFYIIIISKIIRNHQKNIKDTFSSIDKINLSWINHFITFFLILSAVIIFLLIFSKFFSHYNYMYRMIPVVVVISLYSIGYRGIVQPQIFGQSIDEKDKEPKKYEKSTLTEEESTKYYNQLNLFMKNNKPFLDQELTLTDLSEQVEIPFRYLSQVINEKTGQNFYYFINQYRLDEVKRYLSDPTRKNQSILEIAFEAGFNSKATFNAIFKLVTNLTPSQFRKINF